MVARGAAYAMGLDLAEVAKLLAIAPPDAARLAPGELVAKLEAVLAATGRGIMLPAAAAPSKEDKRP